MFWWRCFGMRSKAVPALVYTTQAACERLRCGDFKYVRQRLCPTPPHSRAAWACLGAWPAMPLSAGPWAAPPCRTLQRTAYLFNLEVIGTQRLLDLLLVPARRRLHRAAEPVQHPLESELLHRDRDRSRRGSFIRGPLAPAAATSQPSAADSEPVLAEGRSVSPALRESLLRRAVRAAADADTRPPRRRSTKSRRGTASGMYGNAAPTRIDSWCRAKHRRTDVAWSVALSATAAAHWPERVRSNRLMCRPALRKEMNAFCAWRHVLRKNNFTADNWLVPDSASR